MSQRYEYTWRLIKFAEAELLKCCGSPKWAGAMAEHSFPNAKEVIATGDSIWWGLAADDWREAFSGQVSMGERNDFAEPAPETMREIGRLEQQYEELFGWRFVSTVLGKTAAQILGSLQERLEHEAAAELRISAEQQLQITHNRLKRLLTRVV